jgi:oligopeptide transport system ATP-binding protein
MTFDGTVVSGFRRYVDFGGRSSRSECWYWYLFTLVAGVALLILDFVAATNGVLGLIFFLAVLIPGTAIGVRRLHDIDRSGWWLLIGAVPIIGEIVLIIWLATDGDTDENRFGPDPLGRAQLDLADADGDALLEVRGLRMYFPVTSGVVFQHTIAEIKAVDGVSFSIKKGETLGLVGESGCGKTTAGRAILQLHKPTGGDVFFEGRRLNDLSPKEMAPIRRKMQIIFQDPYGSLNPRMTCKDIIGEPLLIHELTDGKHEYNDRVAELLTLVGLNPFMADRYPHEFSGGQRQRIGIARALAVKPSFIVCDEPVSALDVSIQAQVINLLAELQDQFDLTYLFIAHDLSVVRHISDRVAVMYLGHIVEIADKAALNESPLHPYTKALLSAVPIPDPIAEERRERIVLTGDVPSPMNPPQGCVFNTRCPIAIEDCKLRMPELRDVSEGHSVACIRADGYGTY